MGGEGNSSGTGEGVEERLYWYSHHVVIPVLSLLGMAGGAAESPLSRS